MKNKAMLLILALAIMVVSVISVSAANSCVNAYTYSNGSQSFNVSAGNVCINATSYDANPTATVYCGVWSNCVAGATSAPQYFVGYSGTGAATCVATGWVSAGFSKDYPYGNILTTVAADECTTDGYNGNGYTKGDFQNIVVDGLGTIGAAVIEWLDLIVLLIVLGFIVGIFVRLGGMFK